MAESSPAVRRYRAVAFGGEPRWYAPAFANVPRVPGGKSRRAYLLLICTGACVPYSSRAAVPIDTQHCCVVLKYATTGIDHGLC